MYTATARTPLPTTITGSLPRPGWCTENLGRRNFREAMVDRAYREQYLDAASSRIRDQEVAGLDIVTDGDCRFDADVITFEYCSTGGADLEAIGAITDRIALGVIDHHVLQSAPTSGSRCFDRTLSHSSGEYPSVGLTPFGASL